MRGAVRLATLLAVIALIPSTSTAPVGPVTALAPVEVWADGFGDLQGVAVDADGAVYVADRSTGTVTRIGQDRSRTVVASSLDQPTGLAFDLSGRLVIAEEGANRVTRIEEDGRRTEVISNIQGPRWVAVGIDGTLYVSARASTPERDADALESQTILSQAPSGALTVLADGFVGASSFTTSTPLSGTLASSTATATVTLPTNEPAVITVVASFAIASLDGAGPYYADGEPVERVRVAARGGGESTLAFITRSGREVPVSR